MGILDGVNNSTDIKGVEKDTLGGGFILDSDVYDMFIEMAYLDKSKGGAKFVHFQAKDNDGNSFRQDIYFTNRNGEVFYERNGEKNYLPGYNLINAICNLAVDKSLVDIANSVEEKMVNVYNYDAKKEVPTSKEVIMDLINQPIKLGILRISDDKNVKNSDDKYVPSGELREINEIDKTFRASDGLTTTEVQAGIAEPDFLPKWKEKWQGEIKEKGKGIRDPSLGNAPAGGSTPKATPKSLFKSE